MGRPINNIYIDASGSAAGGEGVASLTVRGANSYSAGTTISFAASPLVAQQQLLVLLLLHQQMVHLVTVTLLAIVSQQQELVIYQHQQ